ncbi:MAG: molybdopterin synthase sulfur carrier subunit [endosymbiont of Galathealinum brachiosum]|uniref:Molybdopterin synthase sulfur carrier subunit n=1 Tax=endosymbiont of Galathealinum brachiosum TaxID=2200906 RepID=A0A370DBS4_9GAMM|nr:MAG: molybdopterin synthase sulfur carrier subunit [endosymbiont of Galathealinum brachiosum]
MSITVKFFARLREQVGHAEVTLNQADNVLSAWNQSTQNMKMPDNTLCAVNMEYVDLQASVNKGDEVAFFPPVTGG